MDRVAVLIPCYNEALTIEKVVRDFLAVIPENSHVYVYDNNSTDGTPQLAAKAGAVVRSEYRQGKGNVIRRMFREINAECYVMVDGDRMGTYYFEGAAALRDFQREGIHDVADDFVGVELLHLEGDVVGFVCLEHYVFRFFTEDCRCFGEQLPRDRIALVENEDLFDFFCFHFRSPPL